jgi:squalene-hopene/tetraprenyl-beta-curcumene cyclase
MHLVVSLSAAGILAAAGLSTLYAAPPTGAPAAMVTAQTAPALLDKQVAQGLAYLQKNQQTDGGWQAPSDPPAITSIVVKAFVQDPHFKGSDPFIEKALAKIVSYQQPDGSISDDRLGTYNTAISISAIAESKQDQFKPALIKALGFLRDAQFIDKVDGVPAEMKVSESNPAYGGFGYGQKGKNADLSNTQTALDALKDAGLKPDDLAFIAAQKFLTRVQNNSETNDQKWAADDGGFIYTTGDGGSSKALDYTTPDGKVVHRSYGSMTYAGLKSMIYAGISKDDPRVKAAWKWVTNNWSLDDNPGIKFGDPKNAKGSTDGLFYYYHTLARALHAYGEPVITDAQGNKHDWRVELIQKLAEQQQPDGSWTGQQKWMENKPILSTAYAILALQEAQEDLQSHPAK